MIPGFDLVNFFQTAGSLTAVFVVALIIFAESGLFVGFFLPGDSVLFTLGFLLQTMGKVGVVPNINIVVLILFIAAVLGDNVGYYSGKKIGPHLFKRPNSLLFRQSNIQKAQDFYDEHGRKTIIIARFIPIVRTFVPIIAGVARMDYRTFLTFNMIGGALWTAGVTYLGYFLGAWLTSMGIEIDTVLLPIIALIVVISVAPAAYHLLKDKKQRQAIWNATKLQVKKLLRIKK
ncbi:DedA family protein [Candidatus Saccharibacteria bacterium]|nr:DedA family protein [Candidatus Saccharibacteria bacterium]